MPLLLFKRFCSRNYFYHIGIRVTVHSFTILFASLFSICFVSYPVLLDNTNIYSLPFTDGHFWQFSPHLHSWTNGSEFIIEQVRVMSITKEALLQTLYLYQDISISNQFKSICATSRQHQCITHSILSLWDYNQHLIEQDNNIVDTINRNLNHKSISTGISIYPISTLGHVKLDHNQLTSADSFILTFVLKNTENALTIWNNLLAQHSQLKSIDIPPCKLQFKLKLLPNITKSSYIHCLMFLGMSVLLVLLFKNRFSSSKLIKSRIGLGLASIFLSFSCFTITSRLLRVNVQPWFLKLFVCITTTVEHIFLITTAVVEREKKEISIKEKVGKGLEQVAMPMCATYLIKLLILMIGKGTNLKHIKDFCGFSMVAITVSFFLSLTVFTAILSIDIRRAELSDLSNDDFQIPKSRSKKESVAYPQIDRNYYRKKNARRAVNTLIICIILLYLNTISPSSTKNVPFQQVENKQEWKLLADQFWNIMNPFYDPQTFDIYPPSIMTTTSTNALETYYQHQFEQLKIGLAARTSEYTFLDTLHPYFLFAPHHISSVILFMILILIVLWMIPSTRESWILPLFRTSLARLFLRTRVKTGTLRKVEYNEDGMHEGALSLQSQFHRLQNRERVGQIDVRTFLGQHVSDVCALHGRPDQLVSMDGEGKIVVWNTQTQLPFVVLGRHAQCLEMNAEVIVAGFRDGYVRVWNHAFTMLHEYRAAKRVTHVVLLETSVLSVHGNEMCEWKEGQALRRVHVGSPVVHLHLHESYLLTAAKDGHVVCWDIRTWQKRYTLEGVMSTSFATQRLRDRTGILVTGSEDGAVKVWDLDTGDALCTLSKGGVVKKESGAEQVGGPLLQFSTVTHLYQPKMDPVDANHSDAISQVVAMRISNPDFKDDVCPGCHTTLLSGFFVASCAMDGTVHVWRLDRGGGRGCVQCAKDYHPRKNCHDKVWQPLFLGKLEQMDGRCLVFFESMVLAGIRYVRERLTWEVWFTALQYYEPSSLSDDWIIPSISCNLEEEEEDSDDDPEDGEEKSGFFEYLLYKAFGIKKVVKPAQKMKAKRKKTRVYSIEDEDAYELLPFSTVRRILPIDKTSFCCDYGNFLKLVSFHKKE